MKNFFSRKISSPIIKRRKRTRSFVQTIRSSVLDDFEIVKELASGFIGRVFLTKHKETGDYFAMKVMSQDAVIAHRQLERVFTEKNIHALLCTKGAFQVVKMYKSFKDSSNLYILMEYQPADLFSLLNQMPRHSMQLFEAKFLIGVIILALESLHTAGVVYRDMKPQNILVDEDGYPVLADFGFAKMLNLKGAKKVKGLPPQTMSFVGTPAYMAPELIKRRYYAEQVDWWAVGILTYEVLLGDVPFNDHNGDYDKLLAEIKGGLDFPADFDPHARNFIQRLLHRTPGKRLGAKGVEEIKEHAWLRDLPWSELRSKQVESPLKGWVPRKSLKGAPNTKHFDLYKLYSPRESNASSSAQSLSPAVMSQLFDGFETTLSRIKK